MIGMSNKTNINRQIELENDLYGDLVQIDYIDTYRNLTYKSMSTMKWVSTYCSNVKYLVKVDDDIVVNPFALLKDLKMISNFTNSLACRIQNNTTVFRNVTHWKVAVEEFNSNIYGPYCNGPAYILSPDLPARLFNLSLHTKHFWLEDYYFTGILAHSLNSSYINHNRYHHSFYKLDYLVNRKYYFVCVVRYSARNFEMVWYHTIRNNTGLIMGVGSQRRHYFNSLDTVRNLITY